MSHRSQVLRVPVALRAQFTLDRQSLARNGIAIMTELTSQSIANTPDNVEQDVQLA